MYYTVQPGDNLWSIAARFGTTVQEILRVNNMTNPNMLYSGLRIFIPIPVPIPPGPGPGPGPIPGPDRELERRVTRLEREVERLDRRVDRLERQINRE